MKKNKVQPKGGQVLERQRLVGGAAGEAFGQCRRRGFQAFELGGWGVRELAPFRTRDLFDVNGVLRHRRVELRLLRRAGAVDGGAPGVGALLGPPRPRHCTRVAHIDSCLRLAALTVASAPS